MTALRSPIRSVLRSPLRSPLARPFARGVSVEALASEGSDADLTVYTFSAVTLGAVGDGRRLVVGPASRQSGTTAAIAGVTVGGEAATEVAGARNVGGSTNIAGLYIIDAGAGSALEASTSADIVVTFNEAVARCSLDVFRLEGASGTAFDTATATGTASTTIDVPSGGAAIAIATSALGTATTWAGLTEASDRVVDALLVTTAAGTFTVQQIARPVVATGPGAGAAMVVASWQPA